MRRASLYARGSNAIDIPMTPLIDCVFLLLVFFLWTSSFRLVEQSLPSTVQPPAVGSRGGAAPLSTPTPDFDEIVVRITTRNGVLAWQVNDLPVDSLAQLRQRLRDVASLTREAPVILHPDPDVPLGDVIDVYDLARLTDLTVAFATPLPEGEGGS